MKTPGVALPACFFMAACIYAAPADDTGAAGDKPGPTQDIALFENGDSIRGSMLGFDKAGLRWQSTFDARPVILSVDHLADIRFRARKIPANAVRPTHDILMANGDILPGVPLAFDGKSLTLDTWYAGKLTLPVAMITLITKSVVLYEGPSGLDGWAINPVAGHDSGWTVKNGVLANTGFGSIARPLELPSLGRIEFDLAIRGGYPLADIHIGSSRAGAPVDSYLFRIDALSRTVDAARYYSDRPNIRIGQAASLNTADPDAAPGMAGVFFAGDAPPPNAGLKKTHFDFRIDRESKTISLYVNGKLVQQYSHLDDLPAIESGLIFASDPKGVSLLEISKIKVSVGSGDFSAPSGDAGANDDKIKQAGKDALRGKFKSIAAGNAVFASAVGDVEIPLAQVEWIRIASAFAPAQAAPVAVNAHLLVHGNATLEIRSWDAKGVVAASPDFGTAVFSPEAFRHIHFHGAQPAAGGGASLDTGGGGDDD